jgi:group I intron endonuclease
MIYDNPDTDKLRILTENKGKASIYQWQHKNSGKIYIGSAFDLSKRMRTYYSIAYLERNKLMYICNALITHGYSAFTLTIYEYIETSQLTKENAKNLILSLEQHYIETLSPDYNILRLAGSSLGFKHSKESLEKMSKVHLGKTLSAETKALISLAMSGENHSRGMLGKTHSAETLILFSRPKSEQTKARMTLARYKKVFVYTLDSDSKSLILHKCFNTSLEAILFFNCNRRTLSNYLDKGILYKNEWILTSTEK